MDHHRVERTIDHQLNHARSQSGAVSPYSNDGRCKLIDSLARHSERSFLLPVPKENQPENSQLTKDDLLMTLPLRKQGSISTVYALRAIPSYNKAAICGTILCPIFGVIAVIKSFQTRLAKLDENYDDSLKYSRRAYYFGRIAICLGLLVYIVLIAFILWLFGFWSLYRPVTTWFDSNYTNPVLNISRLT